MPRRSDKNIDNNIMGMLVSDTREAHHQLIDLGIHYTRQSQHGSGSGGGGNYYFK